ncbi:MAG: hypothetical protein ACI8XC_003885, partial [Gammaproteobacteria bacterium]
MIITKADLQKERLAESNHISTPLLPTCVLGEIRENLPRNAIVTVD